MPNERHHVAILDQSDLSLNTSLTYGRWLTSELVIAGDLLFRMFWSIDLHQLYTHYLQIRPHERCER